MTNREINRRAFVAGAGLALTGLAVGSATGWTPAACAEGEPVTVASPDGTVVLRLRVLDGRAQYSVTRAGRTAIDWSTLGFRLTDGTVLGEGVRLDGLHTDELDETWQPVWGARAEVRSHCNRLVVRLPAGDRAPSLGVEARVFDDGVGLRYLFDERFGEFAIADELTEFRFTADHTAWSMPANWDGYEYLYTTTPLTGAGFLAPGDESRDEAEQLGSAATPLTVRVADDLYLAIHEAALYDYPEMTLAKIDGGPSMRCALVPRKDEGEVKAYVRAPFHTPWRTFTLGAGAGTLVESHLVLNLNEPCAIEDTSWIRPCKYVGVWWEIHKGQSTWKPGPNLGATTENAMRYIDFAAANGIPAILVEGWNVGWEAEDWSTQDFLTPNARFDLRRVVEYGNKRGVKLLAHNETGGGVDNYEAQLDDAFAMYERLGLPGVKTGYAGNIDKHYHHDQWMVNHYQRVIEKAARHRLMINAHEPIKGTGIERTYPNFVSREGVRGQEYEAWSYGNPPEHTVILPFTRMIAGPADYTPGIFHITWFPQQAPDDSFGPDNDNTRVHTTRAHQIALYPVLLSGVQMLADTPENYADAPEFEFLRQVPATWDDTRVLHAEIGDYITVARRSGTQWFVGSLTDEHARALDIPLDFLEPGEYVVHLYTDAPDTDLDTNPNAMSVSRRTVDHTTVIRAEMTRGSGHAMHILPASEAP